MKRRESKEGRRMDDRDGESWQGDGGEKSIER